MEITTVSNLQFDTVLRSDFLVVIDFWAQWCGPCKIYAPILERVNKEYSGDIRVYKVDVDESPELAQRFAIKSIPTTIFFKDGKQVERFSGVLNEQLLTDKVKKLI